MKPLVVFVLCLAALTWGLWSADKGVGTTSALPDDAPAQEDPVLLSGEDFADAHGVAPFQGRVRRLRDVVVRVAEKDYVQCYVRLGKLARHDDRPVIEDIACAVFDPPKDGQPQLRLTFHAPRVTGDLAALVQGSKDTPKIARLEDGVVARDPSGREVVRLEDALIDLTGNTVTSDREVRIRLPDRRASIRGVGLHADLGLRAVRIERDLQVSTRTSSGRVQLTCAGPATVREVDESELRVELTDKARLSHPFGTATCDRITARLVKQGDGTYVLARAVLLGSVDLRVDSEKTRGLEFVQLDRVAVEGEHRIDCTYVKAVHRGEFPALGLGERVIDIDASEATLLLRRGDKDRLELEELRFTGGLRAEDRAGAGFLTARMLTYVVDGGSLEAVGAVEMKTQDTRVVARYLRVDAPEKDSLDLLVRGVTRIERIADGRLGPLGDDLRGWLRLTAGGPVRIRQRKDSVTFDAGDGVAAWVDEHSRLEARTVSLVIEKGRLSRFEAASAVTLHGRGAEITGDGLTYEGGVAHVTGKPAVVKQGERLLRGPELTYREDKTFEAKGGVFVRARLGKTEGFWTIECDRAEGELPDKGTAPKRLAAHGNLVAKGPEGQHIEGTSFEFDGTKGTLRGEPATVKRTAELLLTAPSFELALEEGALREASTSGAGVIEYRPPQKKEKGSSYDRWLIALRGPARFTEDAVTVPAGARLEGFTGGKSAMVAEAGAVAVALRKVKGAWTAERVTGTGGVSVASGGRKVTARRLLYDGGSGNVDVFGEARVEGAGWPSEVRFKHLVFVLTDAGIDLKRASDIEIRKPK